MGKLNEKYFVKNDKNISKIDDLLENDEKILWRGKPKKSAFVVSKILQLLPFALIWIAFDSTFIAVLITQNIFSQMPWYAVVFIVFFFLIHLIPVWIWISNIITANIQHKNIEYCFTQKRIIIKTGIFIDIKNVYYSEINAVNVKVGFVDKITRVGDIYITSNNGAHILLDLEDPYFVANELQKIVHDIKNISFTNNLKGIKKNNKKTLSNW